MDHPVLGYGVVSVAIVGEQGKPPNGLRITIVQGNSGSVLDSR